MKELAPQTADGSYSRPAYDFQARIGDPNFPVSGLQAFFVSTAHQSGADVWLPLTMTLQVESGRYHVYVGNACPWCHRVVLAIIARGLTQHISITWATDDPERASRGGWVFNSPEPVFGKNDLRQAFVHLGWT